MSAILPTEPPPRIGKYEVLSRLGAGGMAEVYLARLPGMAGFSKTVVVKRLRDELAKDPRHVELFIDEAKLAAQVQHKNVVQIFELGTDKAEGDAPAAVYMAMEYVMGTDLKTLLVTAGKRGARVPPWLSIHTVCEVLEALAFAYGLEDDAGRPRRVVHCDVSPENVFLASHGEVKLGDFGVAIDETRERAPFTDQLKGKLPYMSPERVTGRRPTHLGDVYAAGVLLWECLAQRRLFSGADTKQLAKRIVRGVDVPPSRFAKDVPESLDDLVMRAVHVDPGLRPQSARDLQDLLLEELAGLAPRITLEDVRTALGGVLGTEDVSPPPAHTLTTPAAAVDAETFSALVGDALAALGPEELRGVPTEIAASLAPGSWPDTPRIPPPPFEPMPAALSTVDTEPDTPLSTIHEAHDANETTAVVRQRVRPRTPAAPPPPPPRPEVPDTLPSVWVRSRNGVQIGPREPLEALGVLEELGSDDAREVLEISVDRQRWLRVLDLPALLGEAHLDRDASLPKGELTGSFSTHSPTALLAEVARSGAKGRLVLVRYESVAAERVEIGVDMGHIVAFGSSRRLLPGWQTLLAAPSDVPPDVVHAYCEVIAQRVPVSELAEAVTQDTLQEARGLAVKRALVEVQGWPWARFGFEAGGALSGGAIAPLRILGLLPELLAEAKSVPVMMAHLTSRLDVPMRRSDRFEQEVKDLGLPLEDRARLDRFGFGRTLRESFGAATSLRDERPSVRLGYLLSELGLLEEQG